MTDTRTSAANAQCRKIVCHAEGDRCLGCSHYRGASDKCEFAPIADHAQSAPNLENLADRFVSIIQDGMAQEAGSKSIASIIINELLMLRIIAAGPSLTSTVQNDVENTGGGAS